MYFTGKRAVGVEYVHEGRLKRVYANKEVILSAGSIGTPQILMLSGVGPKQHLQEMKVRRIAYSNVFIHFNCNAQWLNQFLISYYHDLCLKTSVLQCLKIRPTLDQEFLVKVVSVIANVSNYMLGGHGF